MYGIGVSYAIGCIGGGPGPGGEDAAPELQKASSPQLLQLVKALRRSSALPKV